MNFAENYMGDGEKYDGWYGSAVLSTKILFCVFLVENCEIPTQIVTFGDDVKMMKNNKKLKIFEIFRNS